MESSKYWSVYSEIQFIRDCTITRVTSTDVPDPVGEAKKWLRGYLEGLTRRCHDFGSPAMSVTDGHVKKAYRRLNLTDMEKMQFEAMRLLADPKEALVSTEPMVDAISQITPDTGTVTI